MEVSWLKGANVTVRRRVELLNAEPSTVTTFAGISIDEIRLKLKAYRPIVVTVPGIMYVSWTFPAGYAHKIVLALLKSTPFASLLKYWFPLVTVNVSIKVVDSNAYHSMVLMPSGIVMFLRPEPAKALKPTRTTLSGIVTLFTPLAL